ncbi:hypothetical protein BU15DRAFT_75083 [Melanogaster broomeanus]|nr:hypothetical protein BU15DRAFT_75083 [Melanogaster broomeanus]
MEAHTASESVVAETHARIDDEIALLKSPICALLTRNNALLPVSRLPGEILATIFLYQAYSFYQYRQYFSTWGAPPWANVSYVCRYWRDVALGCPSLWSFLIVSSPRWTEELLSRSKTVPLRIRSFPAPPFQPSPGAFSKLLAPALLLHTLRLRMSGLGEDAVCPDTLFNRETPALRTLELYHCRIPWSSPIFTALSTLRLRNIDWSSRPTMTELLAMLRHMPALAHLHLENALRIAEDALTSQHTLLSKCLDLPHLSRLAAFGTLLGSYSVVVTMVFLRPTPHFIRFSNEDSTPHPTSGHTLERDCDVPFYSVDDGPLREDWDCCIPLKLEIDVSPSEDLEPLVGDICRTIPMAHLHTLTHLASTRSLLSSSFIGTTFGSLQELQLIKLIALGMVEWASTLSPGSCKRKHNIEEAPDIFAPALAELQLTAVHFAHDCNPMSPYCSSASCLCKALAQRKAKGYVLKKLVIACSNYVSNAQVEDLRGVVDEVDWDGWVH